MKVRFFNTFEPVVPLFDELLPFLACRGHNVEAVISGGTYRRSDSRCISQPNYIRRIPTAGSKKLGLRLQKSSTHLTYAFSAGIYSAFAAKADLNVFLTQPPMFMAWGRLLNLTGRGSYLCHVMDLYPWIAFQAGVLPASGVAARMLVAAATEALCGASGIIAIGRCMKRKLIEIGVDPMRVHFVPNWSNTDQIVPIDRKNNPLAAKYNLKDKFVVMYSGNMGVSHYFDDILEVAKRFNKNGKIVFLFSGGGSRMSEISKSAKRNRLTNVILTDFHDRSELAASLSLADLHLVTLRNGFEGLLVPSKSYGVMAAGRPILYQGNFDGEIARLISENDIGYVAEQGDVDSLQEFIDEAERDRAANVEKGRRARTLAVSDFSTPRMLDRYLVVINSFFDGRAIA